MITILDYDQLTDFYVLTETLSTSAPVEVDETTLEIIQSVASEVWDYLINKLSKRIYFKHTHMIKIHILNTTNSVGA